MRRRAPVSGRAAVCLLEGEPPLFVFERESRSLCSSNGKPPLLPCRAVVRRCLLHALPPAFGCAFALFTLCRPRLAAPSPCSRFAAAATGPRACSAVAAPCGRPPACSIAPPRRGRGALSFKMQKAIAKCLFLWYTICGEMSHKMRGSRGAYCGKDRILAGRR